VNSAGHWLTDVSRLLSVSLLLRQMSKPLITCLVLPQIPMALYPNGFKAYSVTRSLRFFKAESLNVAPTSSLVTFDSAVGSVKLISFCDRNEIKM
jgi:hypothetical protein